MEAFDAVLGERANQIDKLREDVSVSAAELLAIGDTPGEITEAGLRANVTSASSTSRSWLRGNGAAAIYGLMEDAATAEISRSQVWQWVHHGVAARGRPPRDPRARARPGHGELERIREEIGDDEWFEREGRPRESREIFEQVALADEFVEFLTLPAYDKLLEIEGPLSGPRSALGAPEQRVLVLGGEHVQAEPCGDLLADAHAADAVAVRVEPGGEDAHAATCPGRRARIPPLTPLLAGTPTS